MYESFAYYYDRLGWERFSHLQAERVLNHMRENAVPARTMLDVACGTGTFCLLMAEQGLTSIGIDRSKDMLAVAERKAHDASIPVRFLEANMQDFDLGQSFDLITCNFDSLNHLLAEEDLLATFRNVAAHLNKEGLFIIDMNTIAGLHNWQFRNTRQTPDSVVLGHGVFDEDTQTAMMFLDAFVQTEGKHYVRFQDTFKEKGYPIATIYDCLRESGLTRIAPIGPSSGKSLDELDSEPRVWICAGNDNQTITRKSSLFG